MDFGQLFKAFNENATAALLVVCLMALGWLVRDTRRRDELSAAKLEAANAAHLQTAMQVAPLAAKLVTCVEVLERLVERRMGAN